jgi:hypothetical protein
VDGRESVLRHAEHSDQPANSVEPEPPAERLEREQVALGL